MRRTILKYLIECALIFVSVIAAFLTDNLRDRNQQKEQELNLLRDVTTDLSKDTTLLNGRIEFGKFLSQDLTRTIGILENVTGKDTIDDYSIKYSTGFYLNKTTYEGIKNTGGFKFVNDKELVGALSDYYDNREEWSGFFTREIGKVQDEIDAYLRTETKFVNNPTRNGGISYSVDAKSLDGMRGDRRMINLCYEKRAKVEFMTFLMDSLRTTSIVLNKKCSAYLQRED